jgi:hypothetical protein
LWLPVVRPQTFFPLKHRTREDEQHALGVQSRRVNLLAKLVVFTYHGSGQSVARLRSIGLEDPEKGFRLIARASQPRPFTKYRVPECTTQAQPGPGQVHALGSGMSCALLVATTNIHRPPYVAASQAPAGRGRMLMIGKLLGKIFGGAGAEQASVQARLGLRFEVLHGGGEGGSVLKQEALSSGHYEAAGGAFTESGRIAGGNWLPASHLLLFDRQGFHGSAALALEPSSVVRAIGLSEDGTHLCIGGVLHPLLQPGLPMPLSYMACTDGARWDFSSPQEGPDGMVLAFYANAFDHRLYVGGSFTEVRGLRSPGIAALGPVHVGEPFLSGSAWHSVGRGLAVEVPGTPWLGPGQVRVLRGSSLGDVLVGGSFDMGLTPPPQGQPRGRRVELRNLGLWAPEKQAWYHAGGDATAAEGEPAGNARVSALNYFEGALWVGGRFRRAGSSVAHAPNGLIEANGLACYSWEEALKGRQTWSNPLPDVRANVEAFRVVGRHLYAGGSFVLANQQQRALLRFDQGQVQGLDPPWLIAPELQAHGGGSARVLALGSLGQVLCVGGEFSATTAGVAVRDLECRDLSDGRDLFPGAGVNDTVYALKSFWQMDTHARG